MRSISDFVSNLRRRKGAQKSVNWMIYKVFAIIFTLVVVVMFLSLLGLGFPPSAIASAKATTYAVSCTGLINVHEPGHVPDEIQDAWNGPASPDINKSCSETENGRVDFDGVEVGCDPLDKKGGTCRIYNFNLPQECAAENLGCKAGNWLDSQYWAAYIAGVGDPRYLLYYEAFPHGPADQWEPLPENVVAKMDIIIGGTTNLIPLLGKGIAKGVSKRIPVKEGGKTVMKKIKNIAPNKLVSKGDEVPAIARGNRITKIKGWIPFTGTRKSTDDVAHRVLAGSTARHVDDLSMMKKGNVDDLVTDLRNYQKANNLERTSWSSIRETVDGKIGRHLSDDLSPGARDRISAEMTTALRGADEVTSGVGPKGLTEKEYWSALSSTNSLADGLLDASGKVDFNKVEDLVTSSNEGLQAFKAIPGVSFSGMKDKAMFIACRSNALRMAVLMNANDLTDSQQLETAAQVGAVGAGPVCAGFGAPGWAAASMRGTQATYYNGFLLGTGFLGVLEESQTKKYEPSGINSIVLKNPLLIPVDIPMGKKTFRLNKYANSFYVSLERKDIGQGNRHRFYLVPPFSTGNLENDDAHVEISFRNDLPCFVAEEKKLETVQDVWMQPDWNDGEKQTPLRSDLNNKILVDNPRDPNMSEDTDVLKVVSAEGNGIKKCPPPGIVEEFKALFRDNQRDTAALEVSLNNIDEWKTEEGKPVYGYNSADLDETTLSGIVLGGTIIVDALIVGATGTLGTGVALWFTGASYTWVEEHIDRKGMWPEH